MVDDPGVNRLAQILLKRAGHHVVTAVTAAEGIARIAEGTVALIVFDEKLKSGASGIEFINEVKDAGHDIPAILLTGAPDDSLLVEAIRAGVRDFVPKTESFFNHLEPIVNRLLDRARIEHELAESRILAREHEARSRELDKEISRRKRVERALRDAERDLRLMVESVKDFAIFTVDPQARIVSWNPGAEQLFGYAEPEILGQELAILFTPEDRAARVPGREIAAAAVKGRSTDERWHLRKDGSRFFASGVLAPILDEENQLRGFTKIARDMTAYKKALEERTRLLAELEAERALLKDADERKDRFLAVLAHELRNPLAPISNAAAIMKIEGLSGPNFLWSVHVIESQVKQMTHLIDDLLDVSRITQGKIILRKEPVTLSAVVDLALEASRPLIEECRHQLSLELPPETIVLEVDPARLAQVLSNLLNNAAKYTDPGGEILLAAKAVGREVEFRVRDNGIGIAPELLPKIFDMFVQADQAPSRSRGGLGIGLTLVRSLVEQHKGRVFARSDGQGLGTEFVIRLPFEATSQRFGQVPRIPSQGAIVPARPHRVLVVDDNLNHAISLSALLGSLGQEVFLAHDGPSAVKLASEHRPDLMLVDIGLPGIDGYEVARRCRSREGQKQPVLVAMTGYGRDEDRRRSREAGFRAHFVKPIVLEALRSLLEQVEPFAHNQ